MLEADKKLVNRNGLRPLFGPAPVFNDWNHTVYGLWCNDGMVPPPYFGKTLMAPITTTSRPVARSSTRKTLRS